ncbi:acyltransferase [Variovorax sp. J22R133]|uniref:acyltransferase family protein n=1 Tax=Variovorax brevis TaxID=3053503 RepID=UPI00257581F7|nr:acyltransferase [Variovorax sp. J22R133]MDM0115810.1 acyltransferase [Variovorax sp. J22R133]
MPLLDMAKGVACLLIVGHHLCRYGPMPVGVETLAPALVNWLAQDGRLAVQIFLVIAGFLAAGSLAPDGVLRADQPLRRIVQRYGRLAMPYLAALCVSVLVAALVRPWFDDEAVPAAPTMAQLVAHGLLLQDLLGYEALSTGVWYVAIDFQLFVLALAVIAGADWLARRGSVHAANPGWLTAALVLALVCASLTVFNLHDELDNTAFYFFGAYGLGMLAFWIGRARRDSTWRIAVSLLAMLGLAALAWDWRSRIAIAVASALTITVAQRRGWLSMPKWLFSGTPFLWLGRISYSLFLVHFPVILLVNAAVAQLGMHSPWIDALGMFMAVALSMVVASLLYRWVESRPASWKTMLALVAGLLLCGVLVAA